MSAVWEYFKIGNDDESRADYQPFSEFFKRRDEKQDKRHKRSDKTSSRNIQQTSVVASKMQLVFQ